MLKFGFTDDDGRHTFMLGLTDVNLQRLPHDKPIKITLADFGAPDDLSPGDAELVIFHATRDTMLKLAREFDVDEKVFLDMVGEG